MGRSATHQLPIDHNRRLALRARLSGPPIDLVPILIRTLLAMSVGIVPNRRPARFDRLFQDSIHRLVKRFCCFLRQAIGLGPRVDPAAKRISSA